MQVVLTTTLVALLMSATALLLYELQTHRAGWAQDLRTQAELVAQASVAALAANDAPDAQSNLALLRLRPQIESAALYTARGDLFATYVAGGQSPLPTRLAEPDFEPAFEGESLELHRPVVQHGRRLGTMVVRARYDVLPRLLDYLAILAAVTLASLGLAALVARRLQSAITDPIVAVSDVARDVVQQRNYALRAPKTTDDEVGALVDAFNDMLRELGGQAFALQAADRRKDEFLATLAHELRNPLAPVSTALSILERDDIDAATRARLVSMMQRQMQQLVRLIDDLMEVSRISTGRLALRPERLDLVEVVRSAVESVTPALLERGHALVVQWPPPLWVEGDRTRLGQVFANLLANAAKYTNPGGRVEITFTLSADAVEVVVSDNGIGIAPEMQEAVFEMFVQADRTPGRMRAGLGVGLSLARQLVGLHHGTLVLHSAGVGAGTACTVRLPCGPGPTPPPQALAPPPAEAARPLRILLADDNRDFADSLATLLRQARHDVEVAYDGAEALRLASGNLPDVGLFDIGMEGLDGHALAQALRRQPGGAQCLLVAITGWGQQADQQRARAAGFDRYLVKPVDADMLLGLLAARAG